MIKHGQGGGGNIKRFTCLRVLSFHNQSGKTTSNIYHFIRQIILFYYPFKFVRSHQCLNTLKIIFFFLTRTVCIFVFLPGEPLNGIIRARVASSISSVFQSFRQTIQSEYKNHVFFTVFWLWLTKESLNGQEDRALIQIRWYCAVLVLCTVAHWHSWKMLGTSKDILPTLYDWNPSAGSQRNARNSTLTKEFYLLCNFLSNNPNSNWSTV